MGRFLGSGGPPSDSSSSSSSESARRQGRRYEALPANNVEDDEQELADRLSLGTEVVSPVALSTTTTSLQPAITSPVGSGPPQPVTASASTHSNASHSSSSSNSNEPTTQTNDDIHDPKQQHPNDVTHSNSNQRDDIDTTASDSLSTLTDASAPPAVDTAAQALAALGPDAIRIRILDLNGKFFSIACCLDWRVARMKQRVYETTDVGVTAQRLIYRGRVLEDDACLSDYKVEDGHTIHLFVRHNVVVDADADAAAAGSSAPGSAGGNSNSARLGDDHVTIVHIATNNELISSAVFPSDSARRVDPLMLDSPLGNCARRVKLWSSFLLIIYTMKVMGQFALLANDQQLRNQQATAANGANTNGTGGVDSSAAAAAAARDDQRERMYDYPEYYHQAPLAGVVELLIHAFGVYVGGVGFKAAHDTDIRPIRFFCRGVVWLAVLTLAEQIYITIQIANSDIPNERIRFAYGAQAPSKDDIVSANVFQAIMLVVMWVIAIRHAYSHQTEVNAYNESFAAAAMNAVPPAHLPPAEIV